MDAAIFDDVLGMTVGADRHCYETLLLYQLNKLVITSGSLPRRQSYTLAQSLKDEATAVFAKHP